jgi:uncharacterized protein (TIGR02996 family)
MSDLLQGFLDDIAVHPEDPSPWLILADWLEDCDDPCAELVRLTWLLSHEPEHADFATRQARVQTLLAGGMIPVRPRMTLAGIDFAWIPPGTFLMGSPDDEAERRDNERQHRVTLTRPFWLGVHPVTQGQWGAVMGNNPSLFSRNGTFKNAVAKISDADMERFPVEMVSWVMAEDFCQKLSERLGRCVVLPTEAEWEYACRAGTTTPFHFGSVLNGRQANCDGNNPYGTKKKGPWLRRTTVVGSYPSNAWGLYDFHGNLWEWCADGYLDDLESLGDNDPLNPGQPGIRRVLRGGSFTLSAGTSRAARRRRVDPADRYFFHGFRVALRLD